MSFTWNIPTVAEYTVGTNIPNDLLAAINTHFTANSGGGSALWEVATYQSTTPRYIVLRRKSLAAGRIIIFGEQGSTANAAAVRQTPLASGLYIGYSKTSTSTTEDGSWISGAPLSATDYMPAVTAMPLTASLQYRVTYAECASGVWILVDQVANGNAVFGAGELMQDKNGADISMIHGTGTTWSSTWPSNTSQLFYTIVGTDASYASALPGTVVRVTDGAVLRNQLAFRGFVAAAGTGSNLDYQDPATLTSTWIPLLFVGNPTYLNNAGYVGKLKQAAFGPDTVRASTWLNAATGVRVGYGHTHPTAAKGGAFWLLDADI